MRGAAPSSHPLFALGPPLAAWFESEAALQRFRRDILGRRHAVLPPRDRSWRSIAPSYRESLTMAATGLPFQIASNRRYDRSGDPRRLSLALGQGATVFMPQIHQVLPRVTRLMVTLRVALFGPFRDECSFLFLVDGRGRTGMGLHHDGDVDAFWLQLEGRRTVTLGPPVPPGTPLDIAERPPVSDARWKTLDLEPGTLFYMPPRTPHDVVCRARSLALSLTWARPRRRRRPGRARLESLAAWDVASGRVTSMPPRRGRWLWTQMPALPGRADRARRAFTLWTQEGGFRLPAPIRPLARRLALMPVLRERDVKNANALHLLNRLGILAPHDLPLRIIPDDPAALDGWRFA
jgi:mannose-6-phosphate isomerase-like protein (cupin superfamily)